MPIPYYCLGLLGANSSLTRSLEIGLQFSVFVKSSSENSAWDIITKTEIQVKCICVLNVVKIPSRLWIHQLI